MIFVFGGHLTAFGAEQSSSCHISLIITTHIMIPLSRCISGSCRARPDEQMTPTSSHQDARRQDTVNRPPRELTRTLALSQVSVCMRPSRENSRKDLSKEPIPSGQHTPHHLKLPICAWNHPEARKRDEDISLQSRDRSLAQISLFASGHLTNCVVKLDKRIECEQC